MNQEEVSEQIIQRICECGWKAYLTGGAVRDNFIETNPQDYDIVTEATPEVLKIIFPDRKVKTGIGTKFLVTLIDGVDVATYRSDKNTAPGRHNCVTSVCQTIEEDLSRRDFTINAFAICPYTGEIIDPHSGKEDLEARIVRFVGNADQRIYEDYLRMIRAARFTCLIEGSLELSALYSIKRNRHLIREIPPERIRSEIMKVMKYKKPSIFFDILYSTGVLSEILPELSVMYEASGGIHHAETLYEHSMITGDSLSQKDPVLRFIGYLHDIGKPISWNLTNQETFVNHENLGSYMIEKIFQKYKFTIKETERAKSLVMLHMQSIDHLTTEKSVRRFLARLSKEHINWKEWLLLKISDKKGNLANDNYSKAQIKSLVLKIHNARIAVEKPSEFSLKDLEINGYDIMKEFKLAPGPKVGLILKTLFEFVIDDPSINNKESLIHLVRENELWRTYR